MDLIEQLGGYEKAKNFLNESNGKDWNGVFYMPKLKQSLLEYRRQHKAGGGIYEINDNVVLIDGNDLEDDRIFYVDYNGWCSNLSVLSKQKYKNIRGYTYPKKWFRHATDAEIKAGKRSEIT